MYKQHYRHTISELGVQGLVMPYLHSHPRSDTATDGRYGKQSCLRYAPLSSTSLILVDAKHHERH